MRWVAENGVTNAWRRFEMMVNEKRESAQIIQFPTNARMIARREELAMQLDNRMIEALEPAWYHVDAMRETTPQPKH
jgi:hypothetical protein